VIFDIINAKKTFIQATELNKLGWPSDSRQEISSMALHSGLIIIGVYREPLRCFEISPSTLNITRLYPQQDFLSICSNISGIAINKEFICVLKIHPLDEPDDVLVFSRDFVFKGSVKTSHYITQLHIRGKTIVGLAGRNHSIEIWQVKDTNDLETSVTHLRSVLINEANQFLPPGTNADLGLSHNLGTFFATDGFRFYCNNKQIAEFIPKLIGNDSNGFPKFYYPRLGCLDMISAQYFTVYKFESTKDNIIIRLEISNARLLEKVKRVSISVPKGDLREFLGCAMCFTTIIFFFSSGIARLKLEDYESIYERVVLNSSSLLVQAHSLEERTDYPEEYYRRRYYEGDNEYI
jgi:hypothetical protein